MEQKQRCQLKRSGGKLRGWFGSILRGGRTLVWSRLGAGLIVALAAGWGTPLAVHAGQTSAQAQAVAPEPLDPQIRAALDRVRLQAGRTAQLAAQLGEVQRAIRNSERDLARLEPMDRLLRVKVLTESFAARVGEMVSALRAMEGVVVRLDPELTPVEPLRESVEILRGWVCDAPVLGSPMSGAARGAAAGSATGCSSQVGRRYCDADACLGCCDAAFSGGSEEWYALRLLCKYYCANEAAACVAEKLSETACSDAVEECGCAEDDSACRQACVLEATRDSFSLLSDLTEALKDQQESVVRKIGG